MRLAFLNARIRTMDERRPHADSLLIAGPRIECVGPAPQIIPMADKMIDMQGRAILPGFIDAHVHVVWTGMALDAVDLVGVRRIADIVERLRQAARLAPKGDWIFAEGYDRSVMEQYAAPTRGDLDRASTEHPILVRARGGHCSVGNTEAISLIQPSSEAADGVLDGEDNRKALTVAGQRLDDGRRLEAVRRCMDFALSKGVTTVHAMQRVAGQGDPFPARLSDTRFRGRIVVYPTTTDVDWAVRNGFQRIGGCLLIDGGIEAHTAALFGGYADRPERNGRLYFSNEALIHFIKTANEAGLQTAVHAIGDRAIAQVLDAHATIFGQRSCGERRHRIEHFLLPRRQDVERAAALGIAVCAQPAFEWFWGGRKGWFARFFGEERMMCSTPLRSMVAAGVLVGGGSDSYVTPIDPILGVWACVQHPNEKERLTSTHALRLFTVDAARLACMEDEVGTISPGKQADLVVLSDDPCDCPPEKLAAINIEQTWVAGEPVWQRQQ
ncbi:MAG: amidohydrolase [Planctomycetota bacterium]